MKGRAAVVLVALAGCDESLPALTIAEPSEAATVDRCRIRVRTSVPDDRYRDAVNGEVEFALGAHANWRVDGGEITEVQFPTLTYDNDAPFTFGATLPPGTSELEVGNCDGFDECTWSVREITVALRPGSPDCAFAGHGQRVFGPYVGYYPPALADGRLLTSEDDDELGTVALALRDDGSPDPSFGVDDGKAPIPINGREFVPLPDGGFLLLFDAAIARFDGDGAIDASFGNAGIATLVDPPAVISGVVLAPRREGGYTLAGTVNPDPRDFTRFDRVILQLDAAGARTSYLTLDPTAGYSDPVAVDADGNVVSLGLDFIRLDTPTGPDLGFGGGGSIARPDSVGDGARVVFHDGGLAYSQLRWRDDGSAFGVITLLSRQGAVEARVELPFELLSGAPLLASAPDGTLYAASTIAHPLEADSLVQDGIPGTDFAVARIRDGALDTSYGDDGVAHASFMLTRTPLILESILDEPQVLTLGPDGGPWVTGLSRAIASDERLWLRPVTTEVVIARFLP